MVDPKRSATPLFIYAPIEDESSLRHSLKCHLRAMNYSRWDLDRQEE